MSVELSGITKVVLQQTLVGPQEYDGMHYSAFSYLTILFGYFNLAIFDLANRGFDSAIVE